MYNSSPDTPATAAANASTIQLLVVLQLCVAVARNHFTGWTRAHVVVVVVSLCPPPPSSTFLGPTHSRHR